jgi:hypothetical protein
MAPRTIKGEVFTPTKTTPAQKHIKIGRIRNPIRNLAKVSTKVKLLNRNYQ